MPAHQLLEETAVVRLHTQAFDRLYFIELESPNIASALQPGQFVHMQIPCMPDKILRRPFSVYSVDRVAGTLKILYQVVGAGTEVMTQMHEGQTCSLIGPIGNTWTPPADAPALLVAGGVGSAPLYMLAQEMSAAGTGLTVVLGAQTKGAHVAYEDYARLENCALITATDDGSFGYDGFCTVPAQEAISSGTFGYVAVCGPEPVIKMVSGMALEAGIPCEVSLERRMACGVGACLSCVVDTTEGKKRCCVDGPIFQAAEVVW